jgi:hypothetical protein
MKCNLFDRKGRIHFADLPGRSEIRSTGKIRSSVPGTAVSPADAVSGHVNYGVFFFKNREKWCLREFPTSSAISYPRSSRLKWWGTTTSCPFCVTAAGVLGTQIHRPFLPGRTIIKSMTDRNDPLKQLFMFMIILAVSGVILALVFSAAGLIPVHHLAVPVTPANGNMPLTY